MKDILSNLIPIFLQNKIKKTKTYKTKIAKRLALTSKRLDICSAQIALGLHLIGEQSLKGKVCLEIGSGWVLSHAIVLYLLGAERVIATDLTAYAQPQILSEALNNSVISIIRDTLSPFEDHSKIRMRLEKLQKIDRYNFEILRALGIDYIAPFNFALNKLNQSIDFTFSNSVLEHIPYRDVHSVLMNICDSLNRGGSMLHFIHLEDHKDINNDPFQFYSIPGNQYSTFFQSHRGNRIRKSEWQRIFCNIQNCRSKLIYSWTREDKELPVYIDSTVNFSDELDLRTTHIGVYTKKYF